MGGYFGEVGYLNDVVAPLYAAIPFEGAPIPMRIVNVLKKIGFVPDLLKVDAGAEANKVIIAIGDRTLQ